MDCFRHYGGYIALTSIVVLLMVCEPWSSSELMFDRDLIDSGQYWRLFSAHFVHLSLPHMLGNLLGVALLAYVAGPYLNNALGASLLVWCVLWVGVGLYIYADYLERYVGLSGIQHGLILVAPFVSKYYSRKIAYCFLVLVLAKVLWEQSPWYDDMALIDTIGGRVEANAHLLGVVAGLSFLMIRYFYTRYRAVKADD